MGAACLFAALMVLLNAIVHRLLRVSKEKGEIEQASTGPLSAWSFCTLPCSCCLSLRCLVSLPELLSADLSTALAHAVPSSCLGFITAV